jgi:hypothetical protein
MSKGRSDLMPLPVMQGAYHKYVNEPQRTSISDSIVRELVAEVYEAQRQSPGFSFLVGDDRATATTWTHIIGKSAKAAVTVTGNTPRRRAADKQRRKDDTAYMDYVPKDLLDAKLEAIEARMDTRVASIEGKIDAFLTGQTERDKAFEKTTDQRFVQLDKDVTRIGESAEKVADLVSGMRITMAKYLGGAIVVGAVASAGLGVILRYVIAG